MSSLEKSRAEWLPRGKLILKIARFFLRSPYASGTLDRKRGESVIVNLRAFDCFTFVENVVALSCLLRARGKSLQAFRRILQKIRYRQGRLQGYPSRLHYFSDWIHDNEKKGILRNMTPQMGGKRYRKAINFMTTHPELYPQLESAGNRRKMRSIEKAMSRRPLVVMPKQELKRFEAEIHDGDLIGIATHQKGLDVEHVGFAVRVSDRVYLLHASRKEGKVVLSKETLYRHLMRSKSRLGITIARPL